MPMPVLGGRAGALRPLSRLDPGLVPGPGPALAAMPLLPSDVDDHKGPHDMVSYENPKGRSLMAEVLVCKQGDMAEGGVRIVRADQVEIGVIRHSGKYYAYRNLCPHQGGPACEGLMMPQVKELIDENGVYNGKT